MPAWLQWFLHGVNAATQTLAGIGPDSDFAQEIIGARALIQGGDLYPVFAGIYSTHPPTAFLLALPLAELSWALAAQMWAWAMVGCLVLTAWAFGLRWYTAIALAPLLLWPPVTWSLEQITPVWLAGLALAWRFRHLPRFAGALIGLASFTKFLPAFALGPFIQERQWRAVISFVAMWIGALAVLTLLNVSGIPQYLQVNFGGLAGSASQITRADNGALLPFALHTGGIAGLLTAAVFAVAMMLMALRSDPKSAGTWALWAWVSVALLPIAWTYSLLPLLPWLLRTMRRGGPTERFFGVLALLSPLLGAAPSSVPDVVFASVVFSGLSFAASAIRPTPLLRRSARLAPFSSLSLGQDCERGPLAPFGIGVGHVHDGAAQLFSRELEIAERDEPVRRVKRAIMSEIPRQVLEIAFPERSLPNTRCSIPNSRRSGMPC